MDLISAARRTGRALRQEVIKMALLTIPRTQVVYAMSLHNAPAARCASGDTLCFETLDCFGGQITSPDQRLGGLDWDHINPATGPLYVEGARPGDVLRVEILDIALADHGVMTDAPNEGVIGAMLTEESTRLRPRRAGRAGGHATLSGRRRPQRKALLPHPPHDRGHRHRPGGRTCPHRHPRSPRR